MLDNFLAEVVGMGMNALLPVTKVLAILAICMYSLGEHIQLGMKNTLSLKFAKPGHGGGALGAQNAMSQIGTLVGYLVIVFAFSLLADSQPYKAFFICWRCFTEPASRCFLPLDLMY